MKVITAKEAAALITDEAIIAGATFGMSGVCEDIYKEIEARFLETGHPKNISYTHAAGSGNFAPGKSRGEDCFAHEGLIKRWVASHLACSNALTALFIANKVEGWNLPLGTMLHLYREQARGVNFCYSKIGLGTFVDPRPGIGEGGKVTDLARASKDQYVEFVQVDGQDYLKYNGMPITHALIRGTYADENGNISFRKSPFILESLNVAQAARANGGKVIIEVEQILQNGFLNPKEIVIPGIYVDYIVVIKDPAGALYTPGGSYNPAFSGELKTVVATAFEPVPFDGTKAAVRRAAMEVKKGQKCNFGLGIPQMIGSILAEENCADYITMISESGAIGGVPGVGTNFGAHFNVESLTTQTDHFNFFDHGGLEFGSFGLSEVDPTGGINTSVVNGILKGVGGFMNISSTAQKAVVLGSFTAGGTQTSCKDGKLVIEKEGKFKKFVNKCPQLSYSCIESVKAGQSILYVTERAVFEGTVNGLKLIEIAPGADLEKDILGQMEFKPEIPAGGPKLMPAEIFNEKWGGLRAHLDKKG
ncbi:MAG: acylcoa--acetate/3-ketoacidcoatransferase [Spirochaetia bacterium]|jgi:propionate CoA-transferase|nr:acylcoa--acetate/3-ketoacidcoatransferase [Spirochaetia bacterium]